MKKVNEDESTFEDCLETGCETVENRDTRDATQKRRELVVMSCYNCCGCCYEEEDDHRIEQSGISSGYSRASSIYNHSDNSSNSDNSLRIASGISAFLSLIIVSVAIGTGEWLFTEEKLPKAFSSNASVEPDSKVTYSGLWRVCVATMLVLEEPSVVMQRYEKGSGGKGGREEGQTERDVRRNEEMTRYLAYRKPPFFSFRSDCSLVYERKRTSVEIK
ncbi:hypothetical protein KQX54_009564 [Cotesia glomerata]|uniref:Uncharacterized protein n=1 Tax=Cotesia glomerata TaxID=32391 RepID=A0AAV7I5B5_COTGL|nr:hypothetical protein KQX54_009564 [Cotesia glomerata]